MKKTELILFVVVLSLWSFTTLASDFFVGADVAPTLGLDSDFNESNTTKAFHLGVGIEIAGTLTRQKTGFWSNCLFESRFVFVVPATYDFGATQVGSTGASGLFSEKVSYYTATLGVQKFFFKQTKLTPLVGLALGASYIKLENIDYHDALGTPMDISVSETAINLDVSPSIGFSYKISHKLFLDAALRAHVLVPSFFNNSYFEVPIGLRLGF